MTGLDSRQRRSWLFVPGDRPERFTKAEVSGTDVAIVDLEDGVSAPNKAAAREHIEAWLASARPEGGALRAVRINATDTEHYALDLAALAGAPRPDVLVLPKAEDAAAVRGVVSDWSSSDARVSVLAGIESVRGVLDAREVLAVDGVEYCYFGAEDFIADIGGVRTREGAEVLTAKSMVVMCAHTNAVWALDSIVTRIDDLALVESDATFGRSLGFRGKICIHPSHVARINHAYSSGAEREWAQRIVDAAVENGSGAFSLDGQMIDAPVIAQARRILALGN